MIQKFTMLVFLGVLPILVVAQDKIEPDRPTESQNASLISKGGFQTEIGVRKDQENSQDYNIQHPNAVLRYGLFKQLEVRLETTVESQRYPTKNMFAYGLEPIEVGLKGNIFRAKDTSFTASIYGLIGFPRIASDDHQHNNTFYRVRLLFQNELSDKIKLIYNVGRDWDSEEKQQNWIYTISPQFQLSDKWEIFLEDFSYVQKGSKPEHYIDGGFAYFVSNNFSLDVDVGKGLSKKSAEYFMTAGVSFKL
jgi:hypothetical protein